jgi:hypothetical protein
MTYTGRAARRRGWCGPVIDGKAPSGKTANMREGRQQNKERAE